LPETLRSNLRAAFASAVTNTAKDEIRRVCIESGATIDTGFDSVVANWSKVFRRGRYWFEASGNTSQPALHWFFFDELVSIMKKEIEQQRSPQNA